MQGDLICMGSVECKHRKRKRADFCSRSWIKEFFCRVIGNLFKYRRYLLSNLTYGAMDIANVDIVLYLF